MSSKLLHELLAIEVGQVPLDITGAGTATDWFTMKDCQYIAFKIVTGAWAGGTAAVTVKQATDVSNSLSDSKAVSLDYYYIKGIADTSWTRTAITSNTFNLSAASKIIMLYVNASDLDVANGFDCVRVDIATPGSNADLVYVEAQAVPRYQGSAINDMKAD